MMQRNCLYCYKPLEEPEAGFHPACSRKMFGVSRPPLLPYSEAQLESLAQEVVKTQTTVTGVQPKISLQLGGDKSEVKRFTIVGLWGDFILKPATPHYPELPEVEDLTMHLAGIARIAVVPHSLIRLQSGSLAYITRRVDRPAGGTLHMEDMCQLTERLTEDKYNGSYEQIGRAIRRYSVNPGLDLVNFAELVLFSFLTGNADMHLKNFSLIRKPGSGMALSPAYDLVATSLVNPADDEDLALTLNGRKKRIRRSDFTTAFAAFGLDAKQQLNIFRKMERSREQWLEMIRMSFAGDTLKDAYRALLEDRFKRLEA